MIVVRLWEGLGNQIFQYAYARALQERLQEPVYLDRRHNNRGDLPGEVPDVHREIGLQHFCTTLKYADTGKIKSLRCLDGDTGISRLRYSMLKMGIGRWNMLEDPETVSEFSSAIYQPSDNTYVNAHCINREYFFQYRDVLVKELQLRDKISISSELEYILRQRNTVSLHIRLTDYVKHPGWIRDQSYYDRAICYMQEKLEDPYFVVFTDDMEMAKKRFQFSDSVYWASNESRKDYEELVLMSRCKHNILAQSTFSYWGAWLNQNPDKIVIGSMKWMKEPLYEKEWLIF